MSDEKGDPLVEAVTRRLSSENARELWEPVAQEYYRDGPDAAIEFLNAEKQRLEEHIERLLTEFDGR